MIAQNLPHADRGGAGMELRKLAAKVISSLELAAMAYPGGVHPDNGNLLAFFNACADATAADGKITPTLTFTPGAKTFSVAAGATAGPTYADDSPGAVTYSSSVPGVATVNSATGAVTGVAPGTTLITASVVASGSYRPSLRSYVATVTA